MLGQYSRKTDAPSWEMTQTFMMKDDRHPYQQGHTYKPKIFKVGSIPKFMSLCIKAGFLDKHQDFNILGVAFIKYYALRKIQGRRARGVDYGSENDLRRNSIFGPKCPLTDSGCRIHFGL